jgi:hypothetical protein
MKYCEYGSRMTNISDTTTWNITYNLMIITCDHQNIFTVQATEVLKNRQLEILLHW